MSGYSVSLDSQREQVAPNRWRLDAWVSSCEGFEDPGMFLLHARSNLMNKKTTPSFETFANPCTLVEYPYGEPDRPHGMYRDRKASFMFPNEYRLKEFLKSLDERRLKLMSLMNALEADLESAPATIIGPVRIRKTGEERPFMRIKATCSEGNPFVYTGLGTKTPRFVGVQGCIETSPEQGEQPEVDILTYTTRGKLLYPLLLNDLNFWSSGR